ncbi:MAG: serine--tRNA ligase [Oligoflexales bacterium]|nr:serine--tRNA ligase [Oligoflexales bacterium]
MLDIKFIRENPELVQEATNAKNFPVDISKLLELDGQIKPLQTSWENLQAQRNQISREIGKAEASKREELKAQVLSIKTEMESIQSDLKQKKDELNDMLLLVAQPARDDVPKGKDDQDNVEVRKWGQVPEFDFEPKDHITLGKDLGIIDIERGVKLSGSRSYVLKGDGALLEQALLRYGYDKLVSKGFEPMAVPVLVNESAMEGTGYFPLGRDQAYCVEKDKMALVGTSEVPVCSYHSNEMLSGKDLPIRYMAQTTCFRREAGTYGKDTKGLYRVHQFQKIEMVILGSNNKEETDALHAELLGLAESLVQDLGLPYRVVYVCTGDLGQGQVRKHDIETWMPSRENYGETHSCSSFYDFQSRRLNIRYKDAEGKKHHVYTLNNTFLATPRIIIAMLENLQTKDGKIKIPECLQKYLGNRTHLG